jgi:hypothetical protein
MNFLTSEKNRQSSWKLNTKFLSREAKKAGYYKGKLYPWALPVEFASENLQSSIRDQAIDYFKRNRIIWHMAAQMEGPTNHLCSSQVMAVNTLFPFMYEPEELKRFLSPIFPDIEKVLPIEAPGQYIAYEWIGKINYLGEEPKLGNYRHRGLGNTSIDFAILIQTKQSRIRMILGEFKYVERYSRTNIRYRTDQSDRLSTYKQFLTDPNCPIDTSKLNSLDDIFYEPVYQATRHLLMGREIQKHHPEVDEFVNLHLRTNRNRAILRRPTKNLPEADTVYNSIRILLRDPSQLVDATHEDLFGEYFSQKNKKESAYLSSRYKL